MSRAFPLIVDSRSPDSDWKLPDAHSIAVTITVWRYDGKSGVWTARMFPRPLIALMAETADAAVRHALLHGSHAMRARPRTEVGFVAAVTLGAVRGIAAAWTPLCSSYGFSLSVTGVFCHGAPLVSFRSAGGRQRVCELADLLVVVDVKSAANLVRRAALVQAKMARAAGRVSVSGHSSAVQLDLYQNWYVFDFAEPGYNMICVDFNVGSGAVDSGTFGVIDRHWRNAPSRPPLWTQHSASPEPKITMGHPQLGAFIAEMAAGTQPGFGRLATPSLGTDWSKAVEKLLAVTYARSFAHNATLGPVRAARGVNAVACMSYGLAADRVNRLWAHTGAQPPFDHVEMVKFDGEPVGLNVIHVELAEGS